MVHMATPSDDKEGGSIKASVRPSWLKIVFSDSILTKEVVEHHYNGSGTDDDPYIVRWLENDVLDPKNYSLVVKWSLTQILAFSFLCVSFLSSAYTGGIAEIEAEYGGSSALNSLGVGFFVLGFAVGPFLWAPLSEHYGRRNVFVATYFMATAFNVGVAASQNLTTILVLRFFAGLFGSSPITNSGGAVTDMFEAEERGLALTVFSVAPFLGPVLGPIIGGFVGAGAGWRWLMGLLAIMTGCTWIAGTLFVPETYSPVLLRRRASKLSKFTGKVYMSPFDSKSAQKRLLPHLWSVFSKPWALLTEPIVLLLSVYLAIVFGTLYLLFAAYPIVYAQDRRWPQGISGLPFIGILIGNLSALAFSFVLNKRYVVFAKKHQSNGTMTPPEARLPPCLIGCIFIPIGLFWFAWTNSPSVHWIASIAAGAPFGFGLVCVFMGITNYLVDAYTIYAASVLAGGAVLRGIFAVVFPLFTTKMYANLGIHWASSVPGFMAVACVPFPYIFYRYGEAIRARCRYAAQAEAALQALRTSNNLQCDYLI
ncbi:hypothetical protein TRIATDRAFT_293671 [Trichoderma atroviride IMI 206040]|uniref:Major facilitator superfamily (MFS) profile domain-containing protein n=1 Tax=Hypocrea atroviridis (strain ATCC 20476 / IMI 206040) TaxID=452589 RepID=G9NYC4_HYPAI|nr:uncharacterized protein TRIATDRAFT_293671 [Trichoderma atroviride IMI 206040]EHK44438.1 hypothetical protein TRIATDRAFT_293671 [Trichoderma atroviride IMI 206040]